MQQSHLPSQPARVYSKYVKVFTSVLGDVSQLPGIRTKLEVYSTFVSLLVGVEYDLGMVSIIDHHAAVA